MSFYRKDCQKCHGTGCILQGYGEPPEQCDYCVEDYQPNEWPCQDLHGGLVGSDGFCKHPERTPYIEKQEENEHE